MVYGGLAFFLLLHKISTSLVANTHHVENQLRSENGIALRAYYGADSSGAGAGHRIIKAGTRESRYYTSGGTTNYSPHNNRSIRRGLVQPYKY